MISVSNIGVNYSGEYLFRNLSFVINKKDRIGLVGKNGVGKSTILKIIAGVNKPHEGSIDVPADVEIAYLPQEMKFEAERNILDETMKAFEHVNAMKQEIDKINDELATREDYESDSYMELIEHLNHLLEKLNLYDEEKNEGEVEKILLGLGFKRSDFDRAMSEFSGGWQMRVELAKLILKRPEVLLLDEPTNHLDIESIIWLEDYFKNFEGALILISHDRMFLDHVTKRTVEIIHGKVYDYKVAYSKFVELREERLEQQESAFKNQQKYIKQQERFIERFRAKNTKAKQVQSKIKQLEKLDLVEFDDQDDSHIQFNFPPAPRSPQLVIESKSLSKSYGEKKILEDLDFKALRGERLAFVGKNGMGKSTLVKMIVGETDFDGELKIGNDIQIGYYAQVQEQSLDPELSVFEVIENEATGEWAKINRIRALLGSFLFKADDIEKKVKVLSGGEKSRLALARLLLKENNLLILDEPTNHLDMSAKEILKNALNNYNGTLILVSHDRQFLQGLTNKTFEFKENGIKEHIGDIDEFLDFHKAENFRQFEGETKNKVQTVKSKTKEKSPNQYLIDKENKKKLQRVQKEISKVEKRIDELEEDLKELEERLSDPEVAKSPESTELFHEHAAIKRKIDQKVNAWEELEEEKLQLEELK